jgi:hypothetical protein
LADSTRRNTESLAVKGSVDIGRLTRSTSFINENRFSCCTSEISESEISTEVVAVNNASNEGENTLGGTCSVRINKLRRITRVVAEILFILSSLFKRKITVVNTRTIPVKILISSARINTVRSVLRDLLSERSLTVCARAIPEQVVRNLTRIITIQFASFASFDERTVTFDHAASVEVHIEARITRSITVVFITFISQVERTFTLGSTCAVLEKNFICFTRINTIINTIPTLFNERSITFNLTASVPIEIIAWFTRMITVVFKSFSSLDIRSNTSRSTTTISIKVIISFAREIAELHSTFGSLNKRRSAFCKTGSIPVQELVRLTREHAERLAVSGLWNQRIHALRDTGSIPVEIFCSFGTFIAACTNIRDGGSIKWRVANRRTSTIPVDISITSTRLVTVFSSSFISGSVGGDTSGETRFVPGQELSCCARIQAEIFVNFLFSSERTRARSQATSIEVQILCGVTAIVTEFLTSISLGS